MENGKLLEILVKNVAVPVAVYAVYLLVNYFILSNLQAEFKPSKKKLIAGFIISQTAGIAVMIKYGVTLLALKGLILCLILLYAGICDIEKHEVPDFVPAMILMAAFIGFDVLNLQSMVLGALAVFIPQLAIAMMKPGCYGGADIKISTVMAFFFGFEKGIFSIISGLAIAVTVMGIMKKTKKLPSDAAYPVIPWLAAGGLISLIAI